MAPLKPPATGGPEIDGPETGAASRRGSRSLGRTLVRMGGVLLIVGALALGAGFFWFVHVLPSHETKLNRSADGIVVLTGGDSRIADALELLADGRGKRLLISGVHKTTSPREIARLMPQFERLVACCIDLDHSAVNTVGNAAETRRWVQSLNFRSLIVVTSSYHMPRAMAELSRQLADVELIPYAVVSERLRTEPWWSHASTARVIIAEYLKYVVAQVRMRFEPSPGKTALARSAAVVR